MRRLITVAGLVIALSVAGCAPPLSYPYTPTPRAVALAATKTPRPKPSPIPARTATSIPIALAPKVMAAPVDTPEPAQIRAVDPTYIAAVEPDVTGTPVATLSAASASPTPGYSRTLAPGPAAISIRRGLTTARIVALTYDAGADRGDAPALLAYLEGAGIKVTFGMTGRWAESNPDLVRRIVLDGDELMNHTYDHRSLTGLSTHGPYLSRLDQIQEITRTEAIVQSLAGVTMKPLFRPPYGDQDESVLQAVAAAGYRYSILWTVDTHGWLGASVSQIVDRSRLGAQPGAIYVLHVGLRSKDIEATPLIVNSLEALGYRFVTVGQMIGLSGH
ncbi:MAG TPA: polysaccharide deacetylase family protein [Chloroflexota bacterium]|nr:polysaccharide deacetylase family protein [Chloroflexota bacterium]